MIQIQKAYCIYWYFGRTLTILKMWWHRSSKHKKHMKWVPFLRGRHARHLADHSSTWTDHSEHPGWCLEFKNIYNNVFSLMFPLKKVPVPFCQTVWNIFFILNSSPLTNPIQARGISGEHMRPLRWCVRCSSRRFQSSSQRWKVLWLQLLRSLAMEGREKIRAPKSHGH